MAAFASHEGRPKALKSIIDANAAEWLFGLFKNDIVVSAATTIDDLVEADFSGYARVFPEFPDPALDVLFRAKSTAPGFNFAHSGGVVANNCYGYFFLNIITGKLHFVELFASFKVMATLGDKITLTPTLLLQGIE